jgi:Flp pilus assembly pilin Flp
VALARSFFIEEEAQATIEYVLILAVLVSLGILLIRDLIRPALSQLSDSITSAIEERMFKDRDGFHRSPFSQ